MADEERLELLGQVAAWYYEDDLDQREIAKRIGKSRSMVSRLLTEARDRGIVEIRVRLPLRSDPDLEERLVDVFDLTEAHVVAGDAPDEETRTRRIGRLGARTLQSRLRNGMTVTIGWGAALHRVVTAIPEIRLDDIMVLQVMGTVGDGDPEVDGADLARTLSGRLDGDFRTISAPLIVDSPEVARSLRQDRTNANTFAMAEESALAITGIGSIDSKVSGLVRAGYFDEETLERLRSAGVVGDLMGYLIDGNGEVVDIPENERVVALHPDRLASIDTVIGVAGGIAKAAAITATLRSGRMDVLVTDSPTAEAVLALHESATLVEAS